MRLDELMERTNELMNQAYQKYRFDWMIRNGYTIENLIGHLQEMMYDKLYKLRESGDEDCIDNDAVAETALDSMFLLDLYKLFVLSGGFGGNIWSTKEEFAQKEFLDYDYMKEILSSTEFKEWKEILRR